MIIGIGSDLCDIRRIEKSLERFGDRFQSAFTVVDEENAGVTVQGGTARPWAGKKSNISDGANRRA